MANETIRARVEDGKQEYRGVSKVSGFKPGAPANYVRPKPVAVPQKSK